MRKLLIIVLLFLMSCGLKVETPTPIVSIPKISVADEVTKHTLYFPLVIKEDVKTPTPTSTPTRTPTPTPTLTPMPIDSIGDEFIKHGIRFGFAVNSQIRNTSIKNDLVSYHARVVTTENEYKMGLTQPTKGNFTFWNADQIILFGNENNIAVYGHGISWANYNPSWVFDIPYSQLDNELDYHVRTVCSHYQGLSGVDVANEAYMGEGGSLLAGPWLPLGNDYVTISFNSCDDVTSTKIFYNSFFWNNEDADKAIQLIDSGLADGIGLQFHLYDGNNWDDFYDRAESILQRLRQRNKPARFSEVGVIASSEWIQADMYRDLVRLALKYDDVVTDFIIWGVNDPAWRGNVTLFRSDGSPKQSAYAILDELR